jgi:beta-lactamase class C
MAGAVLEGSPDEATALIGKATASGDVSAAALYVEKDGKTIYRGFGKARADTVFLLASITKPMTVTAVMKLVERGEISVDAPAKKYIPELTGDGRDAITVRHLLTHTSGLPDMLADNTELRKRHAPLRDFVAGAAKAPLLFKPGAQVKYQSMGILLAAEIVQRVAGRPLRAFLQTEVFAPLRMTRTVLGMGRFRIGDTARCQVPENDNWHWNSEYWRNLGAPWGGAHSTAGEVGQFLKAFLHPDGGVLKRETAAAMIVNQTGLDDPFGFGWMIKPGTFGKGCSAKTFGHYGSTGTVAWADPQSGTVCVLLTTKPADQSRAGLLGPVSDRVSG